jgi:LmbE family N-acetylglucosaminyl deacetylase
MSRQKAESRKLMCILAHPDDESLGTGGLLAHAAEYGVETHLITATRGQRGWLGDPRENPGPDILGQRRIAELEAAAEVLGVRHLEVLDYMDGELADAPAREIIDTLVGHLRRVRPQVVVTFGQDGVYGHPDHIAISQFTTAAVLAAANPGYPAGWDWPPHQVSKLYYFGFSQERWEQFCSAFGTVTIDIDGSTRQHLGWEDWMVSARLDTIAYWRQVWEAIACHRSQLPGYEALLSLPEQTHRQLWGVQELYRVFSLVNGGRAVEGDLFAGIAVDEPPQRGPLRPQDAQRRIRWAAHLSRNW